MFRFIRKAIIRRQLLKHVKEERRLYGMAERAGTQVATLYGKRGTAYDVLAEVEHLCQHLDIEEGKL